MKKIFIILSLAVYLSWGCIDSNIIIFQTHHFPKRKWDYKDTVRFSSNIENTFSLYDFYLDVRISTSYPYSNLYFFIVTFYPDGRSSVDTVEMTLATNEGKWLGRGLGDIKDNRLVLRKAVRLRQRGLYKFNFSHAMRVDELEGISDIGLRIEKSL